MDVEEHKNAKKIQPEPKVAFSEQAMVSKVDHGNKDEDYSKLDDLSDSKSNAKVKLTWTFKSVCAIQ